MKTDIILGSGFGGLFFSLIGVMAVLGGKDILVLPISVLIGIFVGASIGAAIAGLMKLVDIFGD